MIKVNRWQEFWSAPASARPLAALRIGIAALLLLQAFWVAPQFFAIYGSDGILQGMLRGRFGSAAVPGIYEFGRYASAVGIEESYFLLTLALTYLIAIVALLVGYRTRIAAIAIWALHVLFAAGHVTSYGIDAFLNIVLFYFPWMPIGNYWSLDVAAGRVSSAPSQGARVSLRLLQIHLSIAYFFCGFHKSLGSEWWNGEAIWRSVMMPLYAQFDMRWLARVSWFAKVSGWGTLAVETLYPLGMWQPRLRTLWLPAIVGLHLGIFLLMGLHLFALVMIVMSVSLFGFPAESEIKMPWLPVGNQGGLNTRRNLFGYSLPNFW